MFRYKRAQSSIRQDFLIRDPQIVGSFICYFCLKMTGTMIFLGGGFPLENPPPSSLKSVTFKRNRLVREILKNISKKIAGRLPWMPTLVPPSRYQKGLLDTSLGVQNVRNFFISRKFLLDG